MMVLCKLFYDSFYVATGTSSYCVYYYYFIYIFYFPKYILIPLQPLNTILHSSQRSSEAAKHKKKTIQWNFIYIFSLLLFIVLIRLYVAL